MANEVQVSRHKINRRRINFNRAAKKRARRRRRKDLIPINLNKFREKSIKKILMNSRSR